LRYKARRGKGMPEYKLYRLDGAKRIARAAEMLSADSDEAALTAARKLTKTGSFEIWQGGRLVATIPAGA
jgi:hypothetical protein